MDNIVNRLPPPDISDLSTADQRRTIAQAIEAHLLGSIALDALSKWALRAFHSRETNGASAEDTGDTDGATDLDDFDDDDSTANDLVDEALDLLMFADDPAFAPSREELSAFARQLRSS